jgi:hypothetical protein
MAALTEKVVGIFPPEALLMRSRLFSALERAFSVKFEACNDAGLPPLQGLVNFGSRDGVAQQPPCRTLTIHDAGRAKSPAIIQFEGVVALDSRLRGRCLTERIDPPLGHFDYFAMESDQVLATCAGHPVWRVDASGRHHATLASPDELGPDEVLRDRLKAGRFVGLLPLVHFLREIEQVDGWSRPPLRASFLFDDPNLHLPSYGFVNFQKMASHAQKFDYHVSFATVPIDLRFAHSPTVDVFRRSRKHLSLVVHGNNHTRHELLAAGTDPEAIPLAAQALRRTALFEDRYKLAVDRVMVPPHARCSERMRSALFRLGYEAVILDGPVHPRDAPHRPEVLAGWEPAHMSPGHVPVLARFLFPFAKNGTSMDELVLSAFLNVPLLLYGHHWDLRAEPEALDELAAQVNSIEKVEWMSIRDICRTNFSWLREGTVTRLKPYSRRVYVRGLSTDEVVVDYPALSIPPERIVVRTVDKTELPHEVPENRSVFSAGGPLPSELNIEIVPSNLIVPEQVEDPPFRTWAILRRILAEARDRTAPIRHRSAIE